MTECWCCGKKIAHVLHFAGGTATRQLRQGENELLASQAMGDKSKCSMKKVAYIGVCRPSIVAVELSVQ